MSIPHLQRFGGRILIDNIKEENNMSVSFGGGFAPVHLEENPKLREEGGGESAETLETSPIREEQGAVGIRTTRLERMMSQIAAERGNLTFDPKKDDSTPLASILCIASLTPETGSVAAPKKAETTETIAKGHFHPSEYHQMDRMAKGLSDEEHSNLIDQLDRITGKK